MVRQFELVERVKKYNPDADEALLNRAYVFSMKVHGAQKRASGESYFVHPMEVASILADLKLDTHSIVAALLHDTVEDTLTTIEDIRRIFGSEVAALVEGVTKISQINLYTYTEEQTQAENFRKLVLAMSDDIRVLLVKLADRLHNMRTLHYLEDPEKRKRIARETVDIYIPLAERMGMSRIKDEMEDLSFAQLHPEIYQSIKNRLVFLYHHSEDAISSVVRDLETMLHGKGLLAKVTGRLKTPYSIWSKMQKKNISFGQLSDVMAFRVIVEDMLDCYRALGIIHSHYPLVPGRFKDYISTPKSNHYQSLHTSVIGSLNYRIELQIRTRQMSEVSEIGVAAHWKYKGGTDAKDSKQYVWLRTLLEILEQASSPKEFLENTKLEMFPDQVFCFTPKGELIPLPKHATPVDFAYAIHSKIGDRVIGAKINGRSVPLRTSLQNGDQVEIMMGERAEPSPLWERFVVTGKARAHIRRFIRNQERSQFAELGRTLLTKQSQDYGLIYSDHKLTSVSLSFHCDSTEDLLSSVGEGIYSPQEVFEAAYVHELGKPRPYLVNTPHENSEEMALFRVLQFTMRTVATRCRGITLWGLPLCEVE